MDNGVFDRSLFYRPGYARLFGLVMPLVVGWLLWLWRDGYSQSVAVLILTLVVVLIAAAGDRWAGLIAALSTVAWFDFFFTSPYLSFTINGRDDIELAVVLVLVGLCVTELALWGRRQQSMAARRAGYLAGVLDLASSDHALAGEAHNRRVADHLMAVLGVERCTYVSGPIPADHAVLGATGMLHIGTAQVPVSEAGLPTDRIVSVAVHRDGAVVGHFRLVSATHVARPSTDQVHAAVLLAEQAAV